MAKKAQAAGAPEGEPVQTTSVYCSVLLLTASSLRSVHCAGEKLSVFLGFSPYNCFPISLSKRFVPWGKRRTGVLWLETCLLLQAPCRRFNIVLYVWLKMQLQVFHSVPRPKEACSFISCIVSLSAEIVGMFIALVAFCLKKPPSPYG